MSELGLPYLPSSLVWTKKSLDMYSYCLPYLPIKKVWTFLYQILSLNIGYYWLIIMLDIIRDTFKWWISLWRTIIPQSSRKKIPTITIFEILHTFISMDIHIWPTYPETFCPNFFLAKVWLKNTLPTYSLDICPNFCSFFWDPSLRF